jgi:hypothetical protein
MRFLHDLQTFLCISGPGIENVSLLSQDGGWTYEFLILFSQDGASAVATTAQDAF